MSEFEAWFCAKCETFEEDTSKEKSICPECKEPRPRRVLFLKTMPFGVIDLRPALSNPKPD